MRGWDHRLPSVSSVPGDSSRCPQLRCSPLCLRKIYRTVRERGPRAGTCACQVRCFATRKEGYGRQDVTCTVRCDSDLGVCRADVFEVMLGVLLRCCDAATAPLSLRCDDDMVLRGQRSGTAAARSINFTMGEASTILLMQRQTSSCPAAVRDCKASAVQGE
jgi:hypothetical protein